MMQLPGQMRVEEDRDPLFETLALALMAAAEKAIEQRSVFHLALSGGSTPEPFYMSLCIDPRFRLFPWDKTHVWIVDERQVPDDDDLNNAKMIRESLIDHVSMPRRNFHPMPVMENDPAAQYETELREVFGHETDLPCLDFVLLGMGGDCHTASLFPQSDALGVTDRWIVVNDGPHVTPPSRVTMTYPLINAARHVGVLLIGQGKHEALKRVETQMKVGPDPLNLPITGIERPVWYLDRAAAQGC